MCFQLILFYVAMCFYLIFLCLKLSPNVEPFPFDKSNKYTFNWDKIVQKWRLYENGKPLNDTFDWNEVRASIPFRAWCFKTQEEADNWDPTV